MGQAPINTKGDIIADVQFEVVYLGEAAAVLRGVPADDDDEQQAAQQALFVLQKAGTETLQIVVRAQHSCIHAWAQRSPGWQAWQCRWLCTVRMAPPVGGRAEVPCMVAAWHGACKPSSVWWSAANLSYSQLPRAHSPLGALQGCTACRMMLRVTRMMRMTRMPQLRPRGPSSVAGGQLPDSCSRQSQRPQSEDTSRPAPCIPAGL